MRDILLAYGIPKEVVNAIMILYINTRVWSDHLMDTPLSLRLQPAFCKVDTIAPFLFIICLDYVLRKSIDCNTELGLTITERKSTRYPAVNITDADYADDIAITTNNLREANLLLHSIEKSAKEIGLHINVYKTEYMTFNQHNTIIYVMSSQNGDRIKQVNYFKYLGSYIASTEHDINVRIGKDWYALNQITNIWKSRLSKNLKRNFFRATVESVLVYGAITWTLTSTLEKKIDGAYTRMLRAALNVSWREHMTYRELYNNIPRIRSSIRKQIMRFAGHC